MTEQDMPLCLAAISKPVRMCTAGTLYLHWPLALPSAQSSHPLSCHAGGAEWVWGQLDERTPWDTIAIQNMLMRAKCLAELSSDEIAALGKPCPRTLPPSRALAPCPRAVPSLPAYACRANRCDADVHLGAQPASAPVYTACCCSDSARLSALRAADAAMHRSYEPDETIFSKGDVGATAHRQRPLPRSVLASPAERRCAVLTGMRSTHWYAQYSLV